MDTIANARDYKGDLSQILQKLKKIRVNGEHLYTKTICKFRWIDIYLKNKKNTTNKNGEK